MLAMFWVCFSFVLVLFSCGSCFAFADYEKHCFPCSSSVLVMLVTREFSFFFSFMFWFLFAFLVLFVSIFDN